MGTPVDPLIHAESCPPACDTESHAQAHVVHMHNRYAVAGWRGYPQYPQGLLTLLIPLFLLHPNNKSSFTTNGTNGPKSKFRILCVWPTDVSEKLEEFFVPIRGNQSHLLSKPLEQLAITGEASLSRLGHLVLPKDFLDGADQLQRIVITSRGFSYLHR